jgi:galactoside O-acetyltransferase
MTTFYTPEELQSIGLKAYGTDIYISRKASIYNPEELSLGSHVRIDDFCILSGEITIGNHVHISAYVALYGAYGIEIGDYAGLSPRCTVFSASDDFAGEYLIGPMVPEEHTNPATGRETLEKYVQVGAGTIVMPNLTIKEGSVTGSMTFVNKSPESWGIYMGVPATFKKERKKALLKFVEP